MFQKRLPLAVALVLPTALVASPARAYVLWGADHQVRAERLAKTLKESSGSVAAVVAAPAAPRSKDKALTIWGHTPDAATRKANALAHTPGQFAGLTASQTAALVQKWKATNPELTTVEIVTCDARSAEAGSKSFGEELVAALKAAKVGGLKVKSLPRGSSKSGFSEFWALDDDLKGGWAYVHADTEAALAKAKDDPWASKNTFGLPAAQQSKLAAQLLGPANKDLQTACKALVKAMVSSPGLAKSLKYVLACGDFTGLRKKLVEVK